jgi:predicted house-cleaning NTP pyrophosphatase (Maf/HAM1 superfamily)
MIERVEGSYSNVIGLPMERFIAEIRREGIIGGTVARDSNHS